MQNSLQDNGNTARSRKSPQHYNEVSKVVLDMMLENRRLEQKLNGKNKKIAKLLRQLADTQVESDNYRYELIQTRLERDAFRRQVEDLQEENSALKCIPFEDANGDIICWDDIESLEKG